MSFTLAIIKPDAVANPVALRWISLALTRNQLVATRGCRLQLSREQAHRLYGVHQNKFFYSRLIRHICSGPSIVLKLELYENIEAEKTARSWDTKFRNLIDRFSVRKVETPNDPLKEIAVKRWRDLLGPSKLFPNLRNVEESIDHSDLKNLRQYFAVSDTRNVAHGSDSVEEVNREYEIFKDLLADISDLDSELFELQRFYVNEITD